MKNKVLTEKVLEEIMSRILSFRLPPASKISDEEFAEEMKISRTPVREALNRLAERGLVEARPNRGFWVKTFSKKEVEDLYRLRETLESLAVTLTIKNMKPKMEKSLRAVLDNYPKLIQSEDLVKFDLADEKFHDLIAFYSGNSALHAVLKNLYGKIRIIRRYDHLRPTSLQETYQEHSQILEHMVKREISKAKKSMKRHILDSLKVVLKLLPD